MPLTKPALDALIEELLCEAEANPLLRRGDALTDLYIDRVLMLPGMPTSQAAKIWIRLRNEVEALQ